MDTSRTLTAIKNQLGAMACQLYEVGLFDPNAERQPMLQRIWDDQAILRSVPWMRHENSIGRNIFIRPHGEHNLSLVDDLSDDTIATMKQQGFSPALVVRTSRGNHQAWLKHPVRLSKTMGTAVARALAETFGGDHGAADWRHFGRLAGFVNRKEKHRDSATGLHPFVLIVEARGEVYPAAGEFISSVAQELAQKNARRSQSQVSNDRSAPSIAPLQRKRIDDFRSDLRYAADGNRVDLAYALYAFAHGAGSSEIVSAIRSRDLSHKGNERRQAAYVERTIRKALATLRGEPRGRER